MQQIVKYIHVLLIECDIITSALYLFTAQYDIGNVKRIHGMSFLPTDECLCIS